MESHDVLVNNSMTCGDVGKERELSDGKMLEKARPFKMRKRKENKNDNDDLGTVLRETLTEKPSNESKGIEDKEFVDSGVNARSSRNEVGERIVHAISAEDRDKGKKQKEKTEKDKKRKPSQINMFQNKMVISRWQEPKNMLGPFMKILHVEAHLRE
jgi:hypothetical protein